MPRTNIDRCPDLEKYPETEDSGSRGAVMRLTSVGLFFSIIFIAGLSWGQAYPEVGITNLRKTCEKRGDIPADKLTVYCDCYVDLMQKTIPWQDFLLLDSAVATKGIGGLDAAEKSLLGEGLRVTLYCPQKVAR